MRRPSAWTREARRPAGARRRRLLAGSRWLRPHRASGRIPRRRTGCRPYARTAARPDPRPAVAAAALRSAVRRPAASGRRVRGGRWKDSRGGATAGVGAAAARAACRGRARGSDRASPRRTPGGATSRRRPPADRRIPAPGAVAALPVSGRPRSRRRGESDRRRRGGRALLWAPAPRKRRRRGRLARALRRLPRRRGPPPIRGAGESTPDRLELPHLSGSGSSARGTRCRGSRPRTPPRGASCRFPPRRKQRRVHRGRRGGAPPVRPGAHARALAPPRAGPRLHHRHRHRADASTGLDRAHHHRQPDAVNHGGAWAATRTGRRPCYTSPGMAPRTSRAIIQTGPRQLELRELPVPEVTEDTGLLRVEACGICGSDAEQYTGTIPMRYPLVPGHEPLGVIEAIGDRAAKRWGVNVGDRVAVESLIPCGHCPACREGRYQVCRGRGGGLFGHGYVPLDHPPGLWGAYADYMHLDSCSIVHRIRADLPPSIAVLFNPLGAGFRWAVELPRTGPGDTVLILGPGQRGLASVIEIGRA